MLRRTLATLGCSLLLAAAAHAQSVAVNPPLTSSVVGGTQTLGVANGTSVANPGTGTLESLLPVQTITGTGHTFVSADIFQETRRSNSGVAMADTLPAASATGMVNGARVQINNVDATASLTLLAGSGTSISGSGVIGPGRSSEWVYDAPNTTWRPTMNSLTTSLGPASATAADLVTFADSTGKVLADGGTPSNLSILATGSVNARTLAQRFTDAFKLYADDYILGSDPDDTAGLNRAASAAGQDAVIQLACRTYHVSATIDGKSGQWWNGCGPNQTIIYRTGNYGDTFFFPAPAGPVIFSNMWLIHSQVPTVLQVTGTSSGTGGVCLLQVPSSSALTVGETVTVTDIQGSTECNGVYTITVPDGTHVGLTGTTWAHAWTSSGAVIYLQNLATSGAHLHLQQSQGSYVFNSWFWRMPYGILLEGGSVSTINNNNFLGIWDPNNTSLQEGIAEVYAEYSGTYGNPTDIYVTGHNLFSGQGAGMPNSQVTWVASDRTTTVSMARQLGPQHGFFATGCENCEFAENYIGGLSYDGVDIDCNPSAPCLDIRIRANHFDGDGAQGTSVSNSGDDINIIGSNTLRGVDINDNNFNGEETSFHQINVQPVSSAPGVDEVSITGNTFYEALGTPIVASGLAFAAITGNVFTSYNSRNISLSDSNYVAATYITGTVNNHVLFAENHVCGNGSYTYYGPNTDGPGTDVVLSPNIGASACLTAYSNAATGAFNSSGQLVLKNSIETLTLGGASAPANGLYGSAANTLDLSTNSSERFEASSSGTFGLNNSAQTDRGLEFSATPTTGTSEYGMVLQPVFASAGTTEVDGIFLQPITASASYTVTTGNALRITDFAKGSGSSIGTATGLEIDSISAGSTNYAIHTFGATQSQLGGPLLLPGLSTSSAATSGTVCWTSSTGNLTVNTTTTCLASLEELKDKHGTISGEAALNEISKLDPFWYTWRRDTPEWVVDKSEQPGLGAHQVEAVDPRLVGYDPAGKLHGVRYEQLTAVLIAAVKDLKDANDNLEQRLARLELRLGELR